jgi:hypothetical protein
MRNGDSGHGNPGEPAGDLYTGDSDTDVGDTSPLADAIDRELSERTPATKASTLPEDEAPIPDYLQLNVPAILERTKELNPDQISRVMKYERAHRNRKTLLIKLGRMVRV